MLQLLPSRQQLTTHRKMHGDYHKTLHIRAAQIPLFSVIHERTLLQICFLHPDQDKALTGDESLSK